MKTSLVRFLFLFSAVLLIWPLAGSTAQRSQKTDQPTATEPPLTPTGQQAGSLLIYNFYNSDSSKKNTDTVINLTNTNPDQSATVHVFFVRQPGCGVSDTYVCMAAGQTVTVRASDYDQKGSGYIIAVAVDKNSGLPIGYNYLVGSEEVTTADGNGGTMNAVAVAAQFDGILPGSSKAAGTAALNFDGSKSGYSRLPQALSLDKVASPADGNDSILIVNRIGGDLTAQTAAIGPLSGVVSNDAGGSFPFAAKVESCQLQAPLSQLLADSKAAVPSRRVAVIEVSSPGSEGGLVGAVLNANNRSQSFSGARNFDASALSEKVSLVIPTGQAPSACLTLAAAGADLEMGMSAVPALSVVRGTNITYTLTSQNRGFDSAFNVVIRNSLPAETTFVSATPSSGGSCFVPEVGSPGTVDCTWAGTSGLLVTRTVQVVVRVADDLLSGSEIVNTAETYSSVNDPNPSNNSRTVRTVVTADPEEVVIATQSLPYGKVGVPYSGTLVSVNGTAPLIWSVVGGVLPDGLILNPSTGVISGTPTQTGVSLVTFRVLDGNSRIAQKTLAIHIVSQFPTVKSDFDGDGKTDLSVFRGNESNWFIRKSSDAGLQTAFWGYGFAPYNDIPTPGDYDGDGKADVAVWRPLNGYWYVINSSDGSVRAEQFGQSGDTPVPGDYDGDGKTDLAVWNGSTTFWHIKYSSTGLVQDVIWGASYAPYFDVPVPADYDGDGKTDIAVWRGSTGIWYIIRSSNGSVQQMLWGYSFDPYNDTPVPGDYDGDGKADIAVWRGTTGYWYVFRSGNSTPLVTLWGYSFDPYNDITVPGDYDGDGKTDIAVWRPSIGYWYIIRSTDGTYKVEQFGQAGDTPIPHF